MNKYNNKVYTLEDNVASISFNIRTIAKELQEINVNLALILNMNAQIEKKDDEKNIPF